MITIESEIIELALATVETVAKVMSGTYYRWLFKVDEHCGGT